MTCHSGGDGDHMATPNVPVSIPRGKVRVFLEDGLGIELEDLLTVELKPRSITVVHRRRDDERNLVLAGDEVATVTQTIGILPD